MATPLYTVDEAADRLNTKVRFVRRLVAEERIAFTRLGRHIRIEADVLDAYIAAGRVEPRATDLGRKAAPDLPRSDHEEDRS